MIAGKLPSQLTLLVKMFSVKEPPPVRKTMMLLTVTTNSARGHELIRFWVPKYRQAQAAAVTDESCRGHNPNFFVIILFMIIMHAWLIK